MSIYKKEVVVEETTVAGNLRDYKQSYKIKFYPKDKDLSDKIVIYIDWISQTKKEYATRSLYFSSHEQLKQLIFDLTKAYFHFRSKKFKPDIPMEEFNIISLGAFVTELKNKQMKLWKNGSENSRENQ